jgi:LytS/YehU family sensor histidine kinase
MLTESRKDCIPIDREIDILQNYIALEKIRFGKRLDVQIHLEGNSGNHVIAPLVLLPFVENAFKYGANEMLEQPWISLTVTHRADSIQMKLINGKSDNHNEARQLSTGIGLSNVKRRLELIYPGRHQLRTIDQGQSYFVHLDLQLEPV